MTTSLATLEEAKTHLRITLDDSDAQLTAMLEVATELCESFVGGPLSEATFTETFDGGRPAVQLRRPVTQILSVSDDGTALTVESDVTLSDYAGLLYRGTGTGGFFNWSGTRGSVVVQYKAGYPADAVPAILKHACLEALRHLWTTQRGGMPSPNDDIGDEYAPGSSYSLPRRVMELLDKYRLPAA